MTNKFRKTISFILNTLSIGWIVFMVYIILCPLPPNYLIEKKCRRDYRSVYKGVVLKILFAKGEIYIRLADGDLIYPWCQELIRDKVEVGDSLYKPKGTFDMYIYKKSNPDSVIFIPCDFDCDFYNKSEDINENYSVPVETQTEIIFPIMSPKTKNIFDEFYDK